MPARPKVSVVIPVYNGARYVGRAIESALHQTYDNIEIIVVDDGSTDDGATERAVAPFLDRVRYIRQENRGVAGALNTGVREMTGDIFSWLSHDDVFVRDKTAKQIAFLQSLPSSDVVIFSDYVVVDENDHRLYDVLMDREMLAREPMLAVLRGCLNGCTMLVPRTVFDRAGMFDERLRHTQDYDLWDRIEAHVPIVHCPGVMVRQRVHPEQDSRRPGAIEECDALWLRLVAHRDHAKRTRIAGSPLRFLRGMREFLGSTPYAGAIAGLDSQIAECVSATKVSVAFDATRAESNEEAARALRAQSLRNLELIAVGAAAPTEDAVPLPATGGRRAVMEAATGDYIAFASNPSALDATALAAQLRRMQDTGALASKSDGLLILNSVLCDRGLNYEAAESDFLAELERNVGVQLFVRRAPSRSANASDPFISIVLPTYNRAHTLERAIRSVVAQSWRDWELIVVDDGSTDQTETICGTFKREIGERFRYQKVANGGASAARNIGVRASEAPYIAFLDSDDVFFPEKLRVQMSVLANSEAEFCFCNWTTYNEAGDIVAPRQIMPAPFTGKIYPSLLAIARNKIVTPGVLARREVLLEAGLFDTSMTMCEDIDLWRRVCRFVDAVRIDTPLTGVHLRESRAFPYSQYVRGRWRLYQKAANEDLQLSESLFEFLLKELFSDYASIAAYRGDWSEEQALHDAQRALESATGSEGLFAVCSTLSARLEAIATASRVVA